MSKVQGKCLDKFVYHPEWCYAIHSHRMVVQKLSDIYICIFTMKDCSLSLIKRPLFINFEAVLNSDFFEPVA